MFIIVFVHFKKDFMSLKTLHPIDFITPTILERILLKKINFTKKVIILISYTKNIIFQITIVVILELLF